MNDEILLMASGAAKLLGRSAETVRFYERTGRLHAIKTEDGTRLFKKSDVLKLAGKLNSGDNPEPKRAA
jgi:DNA-binding transcriptional MerR regulator